MSMQITHPQNVFKKREKVNMSDLNETLAQEAAELINGGEWRDGKWYSDGHRDAWRRALKPASDRIEKLETALRHCINAIRQYEMGDDRPRGPAGPVRPWLLGAMDNAIETLEGKDD